MPEPKQHAQQRNWLEQLLRHVPGFRGYLEKEYRRDSDALLRSTLADKLQRSKGALDDYARTLVEARQIDALGTVERVRGKTDKLIARIRGAMQGYSGVFDLVRVNEAVLDRVYEHDLQLTDEVDSFAATTRKLNAPDNDDLAILTDLIGQLDGLDQAWDERETFMRGLE
jgi:hypothetical protein